MRKRLVALGLIALMAGTGCAPKDAPQASFDDTASTISIANFAFDPGTVEASVGDTIVWTNEDDIAHTVTSGRPKKQGVPGVSQNKDAEPDGLFDSGTMELNDTFRFTPRETGTITYFCAIHAGMSARLIVR